jgi:predicted Zn-dependent peptidase
VIERIDAVGVEQLRELAGELFTVEGLSIAAVGPDEQTFQAAIEPLGGVVAVQATGRDGASGQVVGNAAHR